MDSIYSRSDAQGEAFARCALAPGADGEPADCRLIAVNESFYKVFGLTDRGIIGKTLRDILPGSVSDFIEVDAQAGEAEAAYTFELHQDHPEKRFKAIAFCMNRDRREFYTFFIDITKSGQESGLFLKYQLLFENSKNIILFIGETGNVLEANPAALKTYGYTADEFSKLSIRQLRETSSIASFESQFRQAIRHGIFFETTHRKKDGGVFPVEVSSTACTINGEKIIMSIIRDISERKNLEARLVYLANYDFITDIPNRSYVIGNFKQLSEDALANKKHLAVISFDIDKFKLVNDTYGHQSGDAVLKEISQRIASVVTGLLGRVGGDEFLILQPFAASREAVADLVERIFGEFERPIELSTGRITITTSIGISVFPDDSQDMDSLLNFADNAMYKAKISKGNTCVFFSDIQA